MDKLTSAVTRERHHRRVPDPELAFLAGMVVGGILVALIFIAEMVYAVRY